MTPALAVCLRLLDCSPVTALVDQRVFNSMLPQKGGIPAISVHEIDETLDMHMRGPSLPWARVQIDSYGRTKAEADAVAAAVLGDGLGPAATGLNGWMGAVDGGYITGVTPFAGYRDNYTPQPDRQFVVSRDFKVWYR